MGFIADGAPRDEYNAEAREIRLRFNTNMDEGAVAELVHSIFVEYIELDPKGFKNDCHTRSPEIIRILSQS